MLPPRMTPEEFTELRDFIREKTGIHIRDTRIEYLEYRVAERMKVKDLSAFRDYYYTLKYDDPGEREQQELINSITVQESYFYRNPAQLETFRKTILAETINRKRLSGELDLNIWSAACATGEEPYTLAILFCQQGLAAGNWRINIIASDISTRALQKARQGVFAHKKLSGFDDHTAEFFFEKQGERLKVKEKIRKMVDFRRINLLDAGKIRALPLFDFIFCRNVFIYFDTEVKRKVADALYQSLKPGGTLLLGNAETVDVVAVPFEMTFMKGGMVFRKPDREGRNAL